LYLNPGTNGSDKQVLTPLQLILTPLQLILKASATKKANVAAARDESADKEAAKAKYLGDLEPQYHMRGPSTSPALEGAYSSSEEAAEVARQKEEEEEVSEEASAGGGARLRKKGRVSAVGGVGTQEELLIR
jgi:hypothetical protein